MTNRITRRSLLGAAGLGLGSVWLPGVGRVEAQSSAAGPNLLFLYADGGWVFRDTKMRPPWAPPEWSEYEFYQPGKRNPDDLEWEFELTDSRLTEADFSRILRPLYRHRDVMTVVEGLSMLTTALDFLGDDHARAHIHAWSAEPAASSDGVKSFGSAPSVDQRINEFIQSTQPDHQSMDFNYSTEIFHQWLYRSSASGGAATVPVLTSPSEGLNRFFAGLTGGGGGGAEQPADPLTDNANYAINLALQQFDEIAPRLSGDDRAKLEAHRDLLGGLTQKPGTTISCDSPPELGNAGGGDVTERWRSTMVSFAELAAAGFACGISRVATIGGWMAPNESYGLDASASPHQEYEHRTDPTEGYSLSGSALQDWEDRTELMVQRNIVQMELLASTLDVLKSQPGLLENTLVVYMSEISHGNHGHENLPTLLFGSGSGIVTPGRYIKYPINLPRPEIFDSHINAYSGYPHSRLLVSILQGFGVDVDYLGAPSLDGVGGTIDLSGPLPRLTV